MRSSRGLVFDEEVDAGYDARHVATARRRASFTSSRIISADLNLIFTETASEEW